MKVEVDEVKEGRMAKGLNRGREGKTEGWTEGRMKEMERGMMEVLRTEERKR